MTTKKTAKGRSPKRLTVRKHTLNDLAVAGRKGHGIKGVAMAASKRGKPQAVHNLSVGLARAGYAAAVRGGPKAQCKVRE